MNDERAHHGAMDLNQNNNALIFCIVRKNWPYPPAANGSYGSEADEIQVELRIFKILYRLNYLGFYLFIITSMSLQY